MKTTLVFPRFRKEIEEAITLTEPPLGICYIASFLRQNNIDVKIFDGAFDNEDSIIEKIEKYNPDIVGVSIITVMAEDAFNFLKKIKERLPDVKTVVGGAHPTVMPEETLSKEFIDIVVIGEGEVTMLDIVNNINNLEYVKGIYFKKNGKIIRNTSREFISDLDTIPYPAYDLLDSIAMKNPDKVMMSSRGCVFNCKFCQPTLNKLFGKLRMRSPNNVVDEIEFLVGKYNAKYILFHDDTLTFNKKWIIDFSNEIIRRRIKIGWTCNSRVDTLDIDRLKHMKKAGCKMIAMGVESGSDDIRNGVLGKNITKESIIKAFKICHDMRIKTYAYIMVGSPNETHETLQKTIELVKEIKPEMVSVSITTPIPGTYLYEMCKNKNIIRAKSFNDYDFARKISINNENLSDEEIEQARNTIKVISFKQYLIFSVKTMNFKEIFKELFRDKNRTIKAIKKLMGSV